ncbi:Protein extra-macrochaetae [Sarcoptes scabiei]|uniref:Protein extra-macrochaetae n=1 Tax=Sarcoptes scabiei TaxID=52283 RepID=A0A834R2W0_SARSC|nr:Protein extra-macrochaetae [Sarcoptes scabiei]
MTKIQNPEPLSELNHRQMFPLIVGADSQHAHHHHHQQQQHHHHRQMNGMSVVNRFGKKRMLSKKSHRNLRRNKPLTEIEMRQKELDQQEMQLLLAKLKQLVPGIPKNRRLSKLEIIQHVIDYIFDLQMALESHPIASTMAASVLAADFVANNFSTNTQIP